MNGSRRIGTFVRDWPRSAAALAFGVSTALLIHFSWYPDARTSGIAPALTVGTGLAHALAGALTGPRLVDAARRPTPRTAGLLGALTSLIALALFAPGLTAYIFVSDHLQTSVLGYALLNLYTGFFAFLAAGWSLLLLSAGVGWALNRIASLAAAA